MATYTVRVNDTPASIAHRFTGSRARMHELFPTNPTKRLVGLGSSDHMTFQSLHVGEKLHLPRTWTGLGATGLGDISPADLVTLQQDLALVIADTTICQGANDNVRTFQTDYNATGPTTNLAEDGLWGPASATAGQLVSTSAPASCGSFGSGSTTTLTPVTMSISQAYTGLVTDGTICSGAPNQNVINFQAAYNAWSGGSTLQLDGRFGPESTAALNVVSASVGYGNFTCVGGTLSYTAPAGGTPTVPTTPPSVPVTPPATPPVAGSSSHMGLILAGVAVVGAAGAYYWMHHKGGAAVVSKHLGKARGHVRRLAGRRHAHR